jgi:dTDP-4-amino-4,6-dideoxygalactose transaminase
MRPVLDICRKYNLQLVEDCSHATGATYQGRKVGTFGNVSCFSLQSNKTVAAGEGGILGLQLHSDELRIHFHHDGIEKTKVDWEYSLFRNNKRKNPDRAESDGKAFPKRITFGMVVGP